MRILQGSHVGSFKGAVALAFREAGVGDMSPKVVELLSSVMDEDKLRGEAEKNIEKVIRNKYRGKPTWESEKWYIPVPMLHYDTRDIPHLTIETKVYLVAAVEVETVNDFYSITLVGPIANLEKLVLPLIFLLAILDNDLGRFRLVAKDSSSIIWEVPGTTLVQLPSDFLTRLAKILERKSVAAWLLDFGPQGKSVAPSVVGVLLGLQAMGVAQPLPAGGQPWSEEFILNALQSMAFTVTEARDMLRRAGPNLRADLTKEEALRIVLQQAGKGE